MQHEIGASDSAPEVVSLVTTHYYTTGAIRVMHSGLVLQKIASHLPPTDLLALRRTCRLWNITMVKLHRTRHRCLKMYDRIPTERSQENARAIEYTRLMSGSGLSAATFPHARFEVLPPNGVPERTQTVRDFFSVCGHSIQSLCIRATWEDRLNVDYLRPIIFGGAGAGAPNLDELILYVNFDCALIWNHDRLVSDLPNLRRLTFEACGTLGRRNLLSDILARAPNLERLSLVKTGRERNNLEMLQVVRESMGDRLGNLKTLTLDELKAPELQVLIECSRAKQTHARGRLRLKEFSTSYPYVHVLDAPLSSQEQTQISALFHEFLTTQSETLQKLEFTVLTSGDFTSQLPPIRIPLMKMLHQFSLNRKGTVEGAATARFEGGQVLPPVRFEKTMVSNFPSLRRLKYGFPWVILERGTHDPVLNGRIIASDAVCREGHARVEELVLEGTFTDEDVATLIRGDSGNAADVNGEQELRHQHRFPSVTRLDLTFISSRRINALSRICEWSALTVLRLQYKYMILDFNLDELLTGIRVTALSEEEWAELEAEVESATTGDAEAPSTAPTTKTTMERLRLLLARFQSGFGVNNLQHLLELTVDVGNQGFRLTDVGGYLGFAMVNPGVQIMTLRSDKPYNPPYWQNNQISAECKRFITSIFSPYTVIDI